MVDLDKSRLEGAPSYDLDFKWAPNYGARSIPTTTCVDNFH